MNKVLLIPDSYKGTMSSSEICGIMQSAIAEHYPDAEIISIPVADGGEGSVDAFLNAMGGEKITVTVSGPFMEPIESFYGRIGEMAVIEMAAAAGLPLAEGREDPELTTTYGVGQLVRHAVENGARKIVLGLGGSCTNDGGAGAAAALGVEFLDEDGKAIVPVGKDLSRITAVDVTKAKEFLGGIEVIAMCDIDNPLCGPQGAAAVFGPQKGADAQMIERLDAGLKNLADVIKNELSVDILSLPGAGAAGGMGGGLVAFLGARLQMGIETVLDVVKFDELLNGADAVFTGEGKIDGQSLRGKVVIGVSRRAKRSNVPVFAVVGDIADDVGEAYSQGVSGIFSINSVAVPYSVARTRAKTDLRFTMDNILRLWECAERPFGH